MTRLAVALLLAACSARHDAPVRIDTAPSAKVHGAANIQRTLRLLESRSPEPLRVLFYGQSITQSGWSRTVARELARRYPRAELTIENRAIGGFSSEHLLKAAETDLYPYYPDLIIFHVYGSHFAYESLIRRIRERTTAEILLATDHVVNPAELEEESDPSVLEPDEDSYPAFMNHAFLPKIAARYDATLCDVRGAWKRFLARRGLPPSALLADYVHLNAAGDQLMADIVLGCIRRRPEVGPAPMERSVETVVVDDTQWNEGVLELRFRGNRIDALLEGEGEGEVQVSIDGKKPSEWADLYAFTRARSNGAPWPPLYEIGSAAEPLIEDWTLHVDRLGAELPYYRFELVGTRSGRDGRGDSRTKFVSRSQRVVIDPDDWNVEYAFELAGMLTVPPHFTINWSVEPHFADRVRGEARSSKVRITLAQGLPNIEHRLELRSEHGERGPVTGLVVYRPPGDPALPRVFSPEPER